MPIPVDTSSIVEKFEEFFSSKCEKELALLKSNWPEKKSFYFSYKDLEKFDPELADEMIERPDIILGAARDAVISLIGSKEIDPHVRITDLGDSGLLIQDIGAGQIQKLISFQGVIVKRAEVRPRVKVAVYRCLRCDAIYKIPIEKGTFVPETCEQCRKKALELDEEASYFVNLQRCEVQELLERVRGGTPAAHIELILEDDLVNTVIPGDTVEIVGIVRIREIPKVKSHIFSKYIDVVNIKNVQREFEEVELSKEDLKAINDFSKQKDAFETIVKSIAPSIYGHREVKEALALQLFGGTPDKTLPEGGKIRSDIHILLIGDPGAAKCVSKDTLIVLQDGTIEKIGDLVEKEINSSESTKQVKQVKDGFYRRTKQNLLSLGLDGKITKSEATVLWKLRAPKTMYIIKTATGREIEVTGIHPFFISKEGFIDSVKAEDLKPGMFIATPRKLNITGSIQKFDYKYSGKTNANKIKLPDQIDERVGELIGYLLGDGYLRRTSSSYEISITNSSKNIVDRFCILMKELFGLTAARKIDRGLYVASVFSVELGKIFENMGLIEKSKNKSVPKGIQKSPDKVVKSLLRAYFDCEGSIYKSGEIVVSSASHLLLKQIQLLLLRFGIISQLHKTTARATNTEKRIRRTYYRLRLTGKNANLFVEEIGFGLEEKQRLGLERTNKKRNTNIDVIPGISNQLREIRKSLGLRQSDCGIPKPTYRHLEKGDRLPSRETLSKVLIEFEKNNGYNTTISEKIERLKLLNCSDIFWDKIVEITKIKTNDKWVYDLEVDGTYNFVANGLIAHNTRLLQYITELAPKSIYVSGKSVTGAGLTASAEKDDLGEGWTLKAGALVLASGGLAAVDEFDKIEKNEQAALHEVMESQSISLAKAGIVAKFKAKTAILAAANPKFGRFDPNQLPAEQFDIPPTLLSRFDLIFPIRDILDEKRDRELAQYVLTSHRDAAMKKIPESEEYKVLSTDFLRKYIAYARKNIKPILTPEAAKKIEEYYADLRRLGQTQRAVAITPRQIEGLIRLSEASAKARLSPYVEIEDAERAIKLTDYVLRQIAFDRTTGKIDIDIITSGQPRSRSEQYYDIIGIIRDLSQKYEAASKIEVISEAKRIGIEEHIARRFIDEMLRKGELYEPKPGYVKFVQKPE